MKSFRCGHPRTPENSKPTSVTRRKDGARFMQCAFCARVGSMCRVAERRQQRINDGKPLRGISARERL